MIDWEDASMGDPAIDIAGLQRDLGPRFADQVLAHYGGEVDGAFRWRVAFYASIVPYHQVLFGLEAGGTRLTRNGFRRLRRSLERRETSTAEARVGRPTQMPAAG